MFIAISLGTLCGLVGSATMAASAATTTAVAVGGALAAKDRFDDRSFNYDRKEYESRVIFAHGGVFIFNK